MAIKKEIITKRQKELLEIIYKYIKETGYPPTFEDMKETLNVVSNQSIIDLLFKLEKQELIRRDESLARSITILPLGYKTLGLPPLVAFLGTASAGRPIEAIEIAGEWEKISGEAARLKGELFLLKISGDSMINAGIEDGDLVLIRSQKEFVSGDVVLAQTLDGATIKRFVSDDTPPYVYLKPENPKYPIIPFTHEMRMTGKVISIVKNGQWLKVK